MSIHRPALAFCLFLCLTSVCYAGTFTTIDFPSSTGTYPGGIDNLGDISGFYTDTSGTYHGFLLSAGNSTTIDPPGSIATFATGIDDAKDVVGWYSDSSNVQHGFLLQGQTYTTLDYPGGMLTQPYAINNSGIVAGYYLDATGYHGFTYNAGQWTSIDVAGADATRVFGINDNGDVTGFYNAWSGFILSNGQITNLKFSHFTIFYASGINAKKNVIGNVFFNGENQTALYKNGPYTKLKNLSTLSPPYMYGSAINNNEQVVGYYQDAQGAIHGYMGTP